MLNFFPTIYDGELLYSVISRYQYKAGIVNKKALYKDLYKKVVALNSVYFPVHIQSIVDNLPPISTLKSRDIVDKNTLFKIFTAFLNKEIKEQVYNGMLGKYKFNSYQAIGIIGSKISMKDKLFYCEECLKEDTLEYGESYWRVIHQVPGVYFCSKHKIKLLESNILSSESRINFKCLDEDIKFNSIVNVSDKFMNINLKYIKLIEDLYTLNLDSKEKEFFDALYIDKLRNKGYTSKNGSIKLRELEEAFIEFYTQEYLEIMQSRIEIGNSWLRRFIRKSKKNKHVLRHLLMIQFLGLSIEEVFNTKDIKGKGKYVYVPNPRLDLYEQREKWLKLLKENPGLNKSEYKKIGKGLYSWLYRNDNEWFEKITPMSIKYKYEKHKNS